MIHMYDYHFGKMRQQLSRYGAICGYNLNYLPGGIARPSLRDLQQANSVNALRAGLRPGQLPDEIQAKIDDPRLDIRPGSTSFQARCSRHTTRTRGKLFQKPGRSPKIQDGRP